MQENVLTESQSSPSRRSNNIWENKKVQQTHGSSSTARHVVINIRHSSMENKRSKIVSETNAVLNPDGSAIISIHSKASQIMNITIHIPYAIQLNEIPEIKTALKIKMDI